MIDWVRDGYAPTNVALKDAGHDSVTIGAVEGVFGGFAPFPRPRGSRAGMMALAGGM